MHHETLRMIKNMGGIHVPFSQKDYILRNNWGHADPTKRQGAWTGNKYDAKGNVTSYGFEGGVCYGLVAAHIVYGANFRVFLNTINAPKGKGLVRGVMNFQKLLSTSNQLSQQTEMLKTILRTNNIHLRNNTSLMVAPTPEVMANKIITTIGDIGAYHLGIHKSTGGHSISIRIEKDKFKLFDPNRGLCEFAWNTNQKTATEHFLAHFFTEYYKQYISLRIQSFSQS